MMAFSICKWGLISFTLIFLIHHLYMFFINTLTIPKIKDLVNKPNEQYKDIYEILHKGNGQAQGNGQVQGNGQAQAQDTKKMTEELSSFLNDLKKKSQTSPKVEDTLFSANEMTNDGFASY